MAEERLRRNLEIALNPGADFPDRLLVSRTMAAIRAQTTRRRHPRAQSLTPPRLIGLIAAVMAVAVAVVSIGTFVVTNQLARRYAPASHTRLLPASGVATGALAAFSADDAAVWDLHSAMRPDDPLYQNPTVFITHDGGRTWLPVVLDNSQQYAVGAVIWIDAKHIVVTGGTEILSTADGGLHWRASTLQIPPEFGDWTTFGHSIQIVDLQTAFAVNSTTSKVQLYRTRDLGKTWSVAKLPELPAPCGDGCQSQGPFLFGSRGIFAVSKSSDLSTLFVYTTVDGGLTWSAPRSEPGLVIEPAGVDDWWMIDRFGRVLHSTDEGSSWQQIPVGDVAGVRLSRVMPVDRNVVWAVAGGEILVRSTDSGAHWSVVRVPS